MKKNKNIWTGKNKPYNQNSWHFPNGVSGQPISEKEIIKLINTPV